MWTMSPHSCGFSSFKELALDGGPRAMFEEEKTEVNWDHLLNPQDIICEPFSWSEEVIFPAQIQWMRKYTLPLDGRIAKILP